MRIGLVVLGIGLIILWLVGLSAHSTPWLTWLELVAGALSVIAAGAVSDEMEVVSLASPLVIGVGLIVMWIVGLVTHSARWLSWWTFAFGCAYLLLAASSRSVAPVEGPTERTPRAA